MKNPKYQQTGSVTYEFKGTTYTGFYTVSGKFTNATFTLSCPPLGKRTTHIGLSPAKWLGEILLREIVHKYHETGQPSFH